MRDLYNHLTLVQAVEPILVKANALPAAVEVDLANFNAAAIELTCAAKPNDTDTITLKLEHSDVSGSGHADVAAKDVQGVTPSSGIIKTLISGAVAKAVYKFGYIGGKRYIKLTLGGTDSTTGTILAITVIKGKGLDTPAI